MPWSPVSVAGQRWGWWALGPRDKGPMSPDHVTCVLLDPGNGRGRARQIQLGRVQTRGTSSPRIELNVVVSLLSLTRNQRRVL